MKNIGRITLSSQLPYDPPAWVGRFIGGHGAVILNGQALPDDYKGDIVCRGELYHIDHGRVEATPMSGKLVEVPEGEQVGLFRRQNGRLLFLPAVAPREAFIQAPRPGVPTKPVAVPPPPEAVLFLTSLHQGAVSTTTTDLGDGVTRTFMLETSGKAQLVHGGRRFTLERNMNDGAVTARIEGETDGGVVITTSAVLLHGAFTLRRRTSAGGLIDVAFVKGPASSPALAVFPLPLAFSLLPLAFHLSPLTFHL